MKNLSIIQKVLCDFFVFRLKDAKNEITESF